MSADQPRVLVVEDEPAQREVLAYNLEAEGFAVSSAENGEEALMLVDETAPDVIVLDWIRDAQHSHHHAVRALGRSGPGARP